MMTRLIKTLSEQGFKISIDDFGSGASTLTMLKSIKADIIKLDRAFIKDMTSKSVTDKVILKNVVNLVNELELEVIAEGVESRDQAEFLAEIGCPVIQGYYFDKPLPKDEFDRRLSDPGFYARREEVPKTE
jgi:EAL domain-containing protein (putative c-di-GMP-specific phosphodiesterase class I)